MDIVSAGMICPVGLTAAAACAAMRARVAGFAELPYRDNRREPVLGAPVPGLAPDLKRGPRLLTLLSRAAADCLAHAPKLAMDKIPLLVGLAEEGRAGGADGLTTTAIREMEALLKARFHPQHSQIVATGHTAGFECLRLARDLLRKDDVAGCLIVAADSYVNAAALDWLERHGRLKTPARSNGVIPGEASAAVLVRRDPEPRVPVSVKIIGLGFATEPAGILSSEPFLGRGLAEAARRALAEAGLGMHECEFRLSDVTGESYGFKEQALCLARVMRQRRAEFPIWHCADALGDIGAAAGVAELVVAWSAFRKRYAPGDTAIGFTSAVAGGRAAVVLRSTRPQVK